ERRVGIEGENEWIERAHQQNTPIFNDCLAGTGYAAADLGTGLQDLERGHEVRAEIVQSDVVPRGRGRQVKNGAELNGDKERSSYCRVSCHINAIVATDDLIPGVSL